MILFNKIRYKNFLSTGNKFTEVNLKQNLTTLVVGTNGSGKSTMVDAISFALFGKPHRNINKPQLVNSINKKDCLVEVDFDINSNKFKVVRGIKPTVFEIWKNGELINQDSHNREYQSVLEQNILKLNHKSFHQVVVLGSSSFVPFMQLTANNRREVIEDLLDINVFSKMNQLLKEKNSSLKDKTKENDYAIEINSTKLEAQEKYIRDITKLNDEYRAEKAREIEELQKEYQSLLDANSVLLDTVQKARPSLESEKQAAQDKIKGHNTAYADLKQQMKQLVKETKFYAENDTCPSCDQQIEKTLKESKVNSAKHRAKGIQEMISKLDSMIEQENQNMESVGSKLDKIIEMETEVNTNNYTINRIQTQITSKQKDLETIDDSGSDISQANTEYDELKTEREELNSTRIALREESAYNVVISEMLKDTGIKTKIIKQYLPVINKLVNQYLTVLDFFVHFDLDESFNEKIRSRHRDVFTYDSFSEGEKQRIDLALLFTWRQVAKMKNSISTNLLVLDETFDSSLDVDGIENLMKILNTLGDNTNVFVISHKGDVLEGRFENKIEFFKEKNFSKMRA